MDSIPEDLQLFSEDGVKEEIMELEEGQMRLTAGKGDKWLVKQEMIDAPLVKEEVEDGDIWGHGGYIPRDEPDFDEDPEPKRRRVTSAMEAKIYMTQKGLNAEVKTETDAVQQELDQGDCSLPVAEEESVRGSFNAHDLFSNEAAVKEEGEESQNADDERKSCPVDGCFEKFPSYTDLVQHMQIHPKPVTCGFCKKSFAHPSVLRRHYATHTGEKNFACHLCDYKAAESCGLKKHLRIHTKEKPYPCTFCDKSFANSSTLTTHIRIHTGERPFVCDTCGYSATQGSSLKTHLRIHTGEAPYPCTSCDKRFKSSSDLTRHNRTHTGEKPYGCSICGYQTALSGNLKAHQNALHRKEISH